MKTLLHLSTFTCLLLTGLFVYAQEADKEKKIKIDISVTEDGKTTRINKEIPVEDGADIEAILKEEGVFEELEKLKKGEEFEINIKRSDKENDIKAFEFDFDFPFDEKEIEKHIVAPFHKPKLGVGFHSFGEETSEVKGAEITNVFEGSAAAEAGLKEGDIIKSIDGNAVESPEDVIKIIRGKQSGDEVDIEYERAGETEKTKAVLKKSFVFDEEWITPLKKHLHGLKDSLKKIDWSELKKDMEELKHELKDYHIEMNAGKDKAFLGIVPDKHSEKEADGVKIGKVIDNSTAKEIGLQEGDIICELNNEEIKSFHDLVSALKELKPGDKVKVEFIRNGKKKKKKGVLKSRFETLPAPRHAPGHKYFFKSLPDKEEKEINVRIRIEDLKAGEAKSLEENTGVPETNTLQPSKISFASNPNNGIFKVDFELPEQGAMYLRIFDNNGRQVFYEELKGFSGSYAKQIDISNEPNGIYFLSIVQNGKQYSKKIIKQAE